MPLLQVIQGLCFVLSAAFPNSFIGVKDANVAQFWTESRIPRAYFLLLVVQFLWILVDRIIYLLQSLRAKLVLQYTLLIVAHVELFFSFPRQVTDSQFPVFLEVSLL